MPIVPNATGPNATGSNNDRARNMTEVCDAYWEMQLERNPVWATELGDNRYNHLLPDYSPETRARYTAMTREIVAKFQAIPEEALTGQDRVSHEVMSQLLKTDIDGEPFMDENWTINPLHGPWSTLTELAERQPLDSAAGAADLKARFLAAPQMMNQIITNLRQGLKDNTIGPRIGPERVSAQVRRMIQVNPETSSFMPKREHAQGLSDAEFNTLLTDLADIVRDQIYPSLGRFADFLEFDYLPHARTEPGLCHMKGGSAFYEFLVELFTSRQDTAEHIHQVGLQELTRIHAEMLEIAQTTAGISNIREFVTWLRARPDQYLPDRNSLLEFNRAAVSRAEAALPQMFGKLPSTRCLVRPIEEFREADSPSGYYSHAPEDGSRPAYYYVNTYRPEHRPIYNMEALAFHEAVPGHHLQIALAQELKDLHPVRRHIGQTAYVEGWALYTERLCDEFGLYSSPFMRFGMLNYQAWRAARLVVDTGLHAMGWSREKALEVMLENTAHAANEAAIEIDRYICMPGQALSYMTGRMAIDALRRESKQRLGAQFDLKTFHAQILQNGALPLASLERVIQQWLSESGV